jgi:hypothetical protein
VLLTAPVRAEPDDRASGEGDSAAGRRPLERRAVSVDEGLLYPHLHIRLIGIPFCVGAEPVVPEVRLPERMAGVAHVLGEELEERVYVSRLPGAPVALDPLASVLPGLHRRP